MKNEGHWNESFDEFRSEEAEHAPGPSSSRSSLQKNGVEEGRDREQQVISQFEQALQHIPQPILESSREGGNGSWEEGDTSRQQHDLPPQQPGNGLSQTYYRIAPNGEREMIRVTAISPPRPNQVTLSPGPPLPPHYPPSPRISHPPTQKPPELKSLDNLRNVTQQSFAPSQKTIVLNHISNQIAGGVYHSHVSTERMPTQPQREPKTRLSHLHDNRVGSPARISFDYAQNKPEAGRNVLFSSYIPASGPGLVVQRGGAASSNAPQASERHYEHPEEVNFWRAKYQELGRRWQAARAKEAKQQEVAASKFIALEKNYQLLQVTYDQLVQDYHAKLDQNQQYYQQIQQLQSTLNHLQLKRDSQNSEGTGVLRRENEQLHGAVTEMQAHMTEAQQRHEQELREMHEHATMLQMEADQRETQLREKPLKVSTMRRSDNSQLLLDRSRMDSFENTRMLELEMHINKLNAELTMREESFQRELRMANLSVAELVERLKSVTAEKDQTIRNLQEKVGLLESDLNRKDSLIRNLRDEAARPLPPAASLYSSAVGSVDGREGRAGERQEAVRRQLENMRRSLFEREREKLILKQKYEELEERVAESEEALNRRKLQNQAMRRQLNDFDNLQHENEQLNEVLAKKNAELVEMRQMLLEKEQHAGDFENLSKENERLRSFMLKKNEELSELACRLYEQEKRAREAELAHSPQLRDLQEELARMQDALARKEVEIDKLNQSLQLVQANFSEVEFQLERHRNINQEYEAQIRTNMAKLHAYQQELAEHQSQSNSHQEMLEVLQAHLQEAEARAEQQRRAAEQARRQLEEARAKLDAREDELAMAAEEQLQLREFKQKSTKEIQQFQSKQGDLQVRCRDLESLLRNRQQRLARAQRETQEGREQLRKHHGCSKQIQQMTERISHYEMRIISLTLNRTPSALSYYPPPSEVFENKLIYSLKHQNEALRSELAVFKGEAPIRGEGEASWHLSEKGSGIKQRLGQFSSKLESAIGGGLKRVRSVEALLGVEEKQLIQQQNREIQRLKLLAQEMQQQELEASFSTPPKTPTPQHLQHLYEDQLSFLRTSNKQLEERVDGLLRLNKELKQQIEDSLAVKGASLKTFYEQEMRRLEREVGQLRGEKGRSSEAARVYERRVRELQEELGRWRRGSPSDISMRVE